jgi:tRNA(adenine34) deaminase
MDKTSVEQHDRVMMARAIALSKESGAAGEYPYGVLICRAGKVVAESIDRVEHDSDVTRHAEVVAISAAQKALGSTSLDGCVIYGSAEPCVFCSYAIRESRIGRVVYGLHSPYMGGLSKWNILKDESLSRNMPEVFAPPPTIVAGFMSREADTALRE